MVVLLSRRAFRGILTAIRSARHHLAAWRDGTSLALEMSGEVVLPGFHHHDVLRLAWRCEGEWIVN